MPASVDSMGGEAPSEGDTMNDDNGYDRFATPNTAPRMQSAQPGMGNVPPMPPSPYGYGAAAPTSSSQKNYLGILALIFPFVSLSLVGIIMGHLGLSAVKKGTANNHGVALAGTIISWVFTVLVVPAVLAAIAIPLYVDQQDKAQEAAAKADLSSLAVAVATHFVEQSGAPAVTIDGTHYLVGDQTEPKSPSVEDVDFVMLDDFNYCIAVTYDGGQELSTSEPGAFVTGGCPEPDPQSGSPAEPGVEPGAGPGTDAAPAGDIVAFSVLTVGECIADPYENLEEDANGDSWITGVTIVDCASAHYGEVFSVSAMQATAYVQDAIYSEADDLCYFTFEDFMGVAYADSEYYYEAYSPSPTGWKLGDRETTCVVTSYASDTVGTLQGSGR